LNELSDQPPAIPGTLLIRSESGAVFAPPRAPDDPGILLYVMNGQIDKAVAAFQAVAAADSTNTGAREWLRTLKK